MRQGRRLGIDVGEARVGVSVCDPDGLLATPLESVPRDREGGSDLARIGEIGAEHSVVEVIVGLPRSLSGQEGAAAGVAREFARALAARFRSIPVRLVDERLTTVDAHRLLRESGRATRSHRPVVDQQAAVLILQVALDTERVTGRPPGLPLDSAKPRKPRRKT